MDVTVAICTWNRCELLRQTLQAMTRLQRDDIEWELVIVDNNCTDGTAAVIASFAGALPIRVVREATPGLSAARNAAIAVARGRHIVWTDDDVLVDEAWLTVYSRAFKRWPGVAVFGGPIEPWFEGAPPDWLTRVFGTVATAFAARDLGSEELELQAPNKLPYGANMAFLTSAQREVLYDTRLGVRPSGHLSGEESAVIAEVLRRGGRGRWIPTAKVRHFIPKSRQTVAYLRAYYRGYGESVAAVEPPGNGPLWWSRPRWAWRKLAETGVRYGVARVTAASSARWIDAFKAFNETVGYVRVKRT